MLSDFGFVFIFFLLGIVFVAGALVVAKLIRPSNPTAEKLLPYECGEDPIGPQWMKFNIRFYLVALIFLLFDVELVLIFPWAVVFQKLGMYAYLAGALFILILFLADFYLWAKGDLEWVRPQPIVPVFDEIIDRAPVRQPGEKHTGEQPAASVTEPA